MLSGGTEESLQASAIFFDGYARAIGCDSRDGSGMAKFPATLELLRRALNRERQN